MRPNGSPPSEILAALASAALGTLISVLPNLFAGWTTGDWAWVADADNLLYLTIASKSYFYHPTVLADPVFLQAKPVMYPWILFMPGILISKLLNLGPLGIDLVWRIWAGTSIGLAWYVLFRQYVKTPVWALAGSIFMLMDCELTSGRPLVMHLYKVTSVMADPTDFVKEVPIQLASQWRLITPGLSLAFFLTYLLFLARTISKPTYSRTIQAGVALGILFYVYFYFWTAAALGLLIATILQKEHRKTYLKIGAIGLLTGLPSLIHSAGLKASMHPDSLPRIDSFLPIPRLSEFLIPKISIIVIITAFFWIKRKRRDLIPLASIVFASILLLNQQIVTGLQISNFHWNYALGPTLSFLLVLILKDWLSRYSWGANQTRLLRSSLALACGLQVLGAFFLRTVDAIGSPGRTALMRRYREFNSYRHDQDGFDPFRENHVIAGDLTFSTMAGILKGQRALYGYSAEISLSIGNAELDDRVALHFYLLGMTADQFVRSQRLALKQSPLGPWMRDPKLFEDRIHLRTAAFSRVERSLSAMMDRFEVRYVGLPSAQAAPAYLNSDWRRIKSEASWQLWERVQFKRAPLPAGGLLPPTAKRL